MRMDVTPDTLEEQFVRLELLVRLPSGYPSCAAAVSLRNPRGLDGSAVAQLERDIRDACCLAAEEDEPVVFQIIEVGAMRTATCVGVTEVLGRGLLIGRGFVINASTFLTDS